MSNHVLQFASGLIKNFHVVDKRHIAQILPRILTATENLLLGVIEIILLTIKVD